MNDKLLTEYRKQRAAHPMMSAQVAFNIASLPDASEGWEESVHGDWWSREIEGFTIKMHVEDESIFPIPGKSGDTEYGNYVDECRYEDYEWNGNWPRPSESAPLGLPYTSIRFDGPGWVQSERGGYFIPDGIEETFAYYRDAGQSKQVAWELTKQYVEDQLTMLFSSPLTNCIVHVAAYKDDIELASTNMGTDVAGDDEGRAYIFAMVEEHDMVTEVVESAHTSIAKLTA